MTHSRVLVTAALPYANGSLHIGHLLEYVQADIYVRSLRALGQDALFICANDAHGTPIELNAKKRNMTPEAMVAEFHSEHQRDLGRYGVVFSYFGLTHSDTNRTLVARAFAGLKEAGMIEEREIDGNFCPKDQRFLPDRFIKGACPKCRSQDQYGDVCEQCGATYAPTDLLDPYCALCQTKPERRPSRHAFFKLSDPSQSEFLRTWIDSGALQTDVANYVRSWIEGGLKDWCITRDGPYFGFPVPDMANKFFYVWLDAPFGYMAASVEWGQKHGVDEAALWRSSETRIEHIIGKDIMYFHTLFWPAVLKSLNYSLPSRVHVHGMLTVDGEKMSKSRGTFIRASTFAEHVDPEALRYYLATKLTPESKDLDLSIDDMVSRVNAELVNKHANLFSRVGQFVTGRLGNRLGTLPFTTAEAHQEVEDAPQSPGQVLTGIDVSLGATREVCLPLARMVVRAGRRIEHALAARELAQASREIAHIADVGNEFMQAMRPWDLIRQDEALARGVCTFVANICQALAIYLAPIVPQFAEAAAAALDTQLLPMSHTRLFALTERPWGQPARLFERLERSQFEKIIEASKENLAGAPPAAPESAPTVAQAQAITPLRATIDIEAFSRVDLRIGKVLSAEAVPKSKKLLRLMVDLGEAEPRQVLSGIAQQISAEAIVGQSVTIVANLKPAKIMGLMSHGMLVAADGPDGSLSLLAPTQATQPGATVR